MLLFYPWFSANNQVCSCPASEPVIVITGDGALHLALCYISHGRTGEAPFAHYLITSLIQRSDWGFLRGTSNGLWR